MTDYCIFSFNIMMDFPPWWVEGPYLEHSDMPQNNIELSLQRIEDDKMMPMIGEIFIVLPYHQV
jgi:hypothetical protein